MHKRYQKYFQWRILLTNKYTQDMTGTGDHIEMDDEKEPERYYDWMLWKLKQEENKGDSS